MAISTHVWPTLSALALVTLAAACANSSPVEGTTGVGAGTTSSTSSTSSTSQGGAGPGGAGQGGQTAGTGGNGGAAQGTGGMGTSTTTSATTGSGSSDPCAGSPDGKHCGGDLGGLADHGSLYTCAGGVTASAMACPSGCAGSSCIAPPADPCGSAQFGNGAYCGGTLSGGDANALYNCQNGSTAGKQNCPTGCKVNPPGVADACNPQGDPCQNANGGNGAYCGASLGSGDPNVLYNCQNMATASQTACTNGCQVNPPGVADACKPAGGGQCCLDHPAGVVTQPYSACGGGGSHYGIDYGTAIGTPIYAGLAGTVVGSALGFPNCYNNGCSQSCWNSFNYVKIKSDCGDPDNAGHDFFVYYLHISDLAPGIANGSHVDQGQLVALSGNSGCSSGPHIHIETASVSQGAGAVLNTCSSVDPSSRYCN